MSQAPQQLRVLQGAVTKLQEAPLLTGSTTLANLSGSAGGQGEHVATSIQQQTSSAAAGELVPLRMNFKGAEVQCT